MQRYFNVLTTQYIERNNINNNNKNLSIMKKNYLLAVALALTAMVSCTDESFVGDQGLKEANEGVGAISFTSGTPAMTRATGADAALALKYKFKVYGVKKVSSTYSNVFATGTYNSGEDYNNDPLAYWVWYQTSTANSTTSNTSNWDYVGGAGTHGTTDYLATVETDKDQTIKYWDYGADQYEFVAYSATEGSPTISKYQKDGFTVVATPAQLAGLYVADKLTISTKNNDATKPSTGTNQIGNIVQFTFRAAAAKVRLGIYETIPGYEVRNVKFLPNDSEFSATTANAKLSGSFNGTSSSTSGTYNVTYNSTTGIAEFDNTGSASDYYDFGSFASATPTAIGTSSISPMWATGSADYQSALPNTDNVANMILYVDYDLYNTVTQETIHVYGAKAVVPSMYMTWNPNYAYTYLFKISDNTNGQTSTASGTPAGLFPITFDAVTVAAADGSEVGTITTVSTPAITTYQDGSVSSSGITYAHAKGSIYITVNTDGTVKDLSVDNMKLYTVTSGTTEADLILTTKTKTAVAGGSADALSILDAEATSQGIRFASGKAAKFTPTASTTYALEYLQIDEVTGVTAGTTVVTGYYTKTGASAPYTYTKITTPDTKADTETTYYTVVPQYKIIEVGADPVTP